MNQSEKFGTFRLPKQLSIDNAHVGSIPKLTVDSMVSSLLDVFHSTTCRQKHHSHRLMYGHVRSAPRPGGVNTSIQADRYSNSQAWCGLQEKESSDVWQCCSFVRYHPLVRSEEPFKLPTKCGISSLSFFVSSTGKL
jgi:hypothetical protein